MLFRSAAEEARAGFEAEESLARAARAEAEGEVSALNAEMAALKRLVERGDTGGKSILDLVRVARGYETAFGAALGDDLSAGLAGDGSGWHALPAYGAAQALPAGVEPLAPHVDGPKALARRLSQVGLVADAQTGAALQAGLAPGQRLVTQGGDLFRWDGMRVMAGGSQGESYHQARLAGEGQADSREDMDSARAGCPSVWAEWAGREGRTVGSFPDHPARKGLQRSTATSGADQREGGSQWVQFSRRRLAASLRQVPMERRRRARSRPNTPEGR